jgi:hypothetical protein
VMFFSIGDDGNDETLKKKKDGFPMCGWNCHKFTEVREVQICHIPCFRWFYQRNVLQCSANHHQKTSGYISGWWFQTFLIFHALGIIIPTDWYG